MKQRSSSDATEPPTRTRSRGTTEALANARRELEIVRRRQFQLDQVDAGIVPFYTTRTPHRRSSP